jgi:hypothetical protein
MRGVIAVVWGVIVAVTTIAVVTLAAMLRFPGHSTEGTIMRVAGAIVGVGLGIAAYLKNAKPPGPPADG